MSDHIELHDSRVEVNVTGDTVVLLLRPAYVHHWDRSSGRWRGEGRSQSADIVIARGTLSSAPATGSFEISDGWFEIAGRLHENVVPVPLEQGGVVRGRLELVNADPIELMGEGVTAHLVGEPVYVEDLPHEWAPDEGAA
jgi:hypothetical protein